VCVILSSKQRREYKYRQTERNIIKRKKPNASLAHLADHVRKGVEVNSRSLDLASNDGGVGVTGRWISGILLAR
jgi:hypothetical protein